MPFFFPARLRSVIGAERLYNMLAALFFLSLALVFYLPSLGWLPRGIHEWAQADRLSLAINFFDRGMHLFRPQTLNLSSIDGVVGVECPLIPYLAALGAKLTGRHSIVLWFRGLNVALAGLAGYYTFRLVFERTRQFFAALVPGVFLATSPVFAYYAGSFLPDPAGVALTLVAAYYLFLYTRVPQFGYLVGAIGLFTLATIIKTSAAIYLGAALGTVFLWSYLHPSVLTVRQKLVFMALAMASVGIVVGYTLFNRYLNAQYHSTMFLATVMPIQSSKQYGDIITRISLLWQFEYFTRAQYCVLAGSLGVCLLGLPRLIRTEWLWLSQLGLAAVGGWLFFWLMGAQLMDHDYYVLAPYWPGLVLLVALATVQAASWRWLPALGRSLGFGALLVLLLVFGLHRFRARMDDPYQHFSDYYTYRWMQGGASTLAIAKIPTTDNILVLGEDAPNLVLTYFDRRGLVWKPDINRMPSAELLEKMTTNGLDCLVMRQGIFHELEDAHPDLLPSFRLAASTPQYVVLKRLALTPHW